MSELDDLKARVAELEHQVAELASGTRFHRDALRSLDDQGDELAGKIDATHLGVIALNASVGLTQRAVHKAVSTGDLHTAKLDRMQGQLDTLGEAQRSTVGLLEEILRRLPPGTPAS